MLEREGRLIPTRSIGEGWRELALDEAAGTLYRFVLADGLKGPDPAARFQPQDVHGPSEVIDPQAIAGPTGAGEDGPGMRRSFTSSMSAPSRKKAPSAPQSDGSIALRN